MKGELVDRAKAVAQVFRVARDERDAWVNWPARVAAMMAAEFEVDAHQLHTVLERYVRDHLAEGRRGPAEPALTGSAGSICRNRRAARKGARSPLVLRRTG
jgi:hypothetical protein